MNDSQQFVTYLGDGVYVWYDKRRDSVVLATGSHDNPGNVVVLEPDVLSEFNAWCKKAITFLGEKEESK